MAFIEHVEESFPSLTSNGEPTLLKCIHTYIGTGEERWSHDVCHKYVVVHDIVGGDLAFPISWSLQQFFDTLHKVGISSFNLEIRCCGHGCNCYHKNTLMP